MDSGLTPVVPSFNGPSQAHNELLLLERLDRYKLVARLGQGGMAEVFLAAWEIEPFVHRPVVIKRLYEHFARDANLVQMFLDEARLLCQLDHPHVVKTLEAGVIDGHACIAMEYLQGQPLHAVQRRAQEIGGMPIDLAVQIVVCMLDGLDYAHDARAADGTSLEVVHRDVSPHNVLVANDGTVKVLDFGIAKAATQEGRTATGMVKGKVGYIAPEQATGGAIDRRADVWSVGVVLWELITGVRLFKTDSEVATINATLRGAIPSVRSLRLETPPDLDAVVTRALQRHVGDRYQTAAAMQRDLERWLHTAGIQRDASGLARMMHVAFAKEIVEQQRLVTVLMARSDCTPPSLSATARASAGPNSTSAMIAATVPPSEDDALAAPPARRKLGAASVAAVFALFALCSAAATHLVRETAPQAAAAPAPVAMNAPAPIPSPASVPSPIPISSPVPVAVPVPAPVPISASVSPPIRPTVASRSPAHPVTPPPSSTTPVVASTAAPAPPTDDFGFLTIDSSPWSVVTAGGKALGQTPIVGLRLPAGTHTLTLKNPELDLQTTYSVTIVAGKTAVRRVGLE